MGTVGRSYSYNAYCDVCGFKFKADQLKRRWDGVMVCEDDFEYRHPMDFYKVKSDHHPLPFVRTEPADSTGFLPTEYPSTVPFAGVSNAAIAMRFTVGASNRRLLGVRVGGVNAPSLRMVEFPFVAKLWDDVGTLLQTWPGLYLRYIFGAAGEFAWASAPLTPAYVLVSGTTYRVSINLFGNSNIIPSTTIMTSVQPYHTYINSKWIAADAFPNNTLSAGSATPYIDILTGSTN